MTTTQAKKMGYTAWEKRTRVGTRMGGLGNKLECAIIHATWEIFHDSKTEPVIVGAKTRKQALAMLDKHIKQNAP